MVTPYRNHDSSSPLVVQLEDRRVSVRVREVLVLIWCELNFAILSIYISVCYTQYILETWQKNLLLLESLIFIY